MNNSSATGTTPAASRQTAWGFFTANLALPGSGSLAAGRKIGYPQSALSVAGLGLTLVFGLRFIIWGISNWSRLQAMDNDPLGKWLELWHEVRWALLGIGLFALALLWALSTSLSLLQKAKPPRPPKLP